MPLDVAPPRSTRFGSLLVLSRVHWVRPELVAEVKFFTWTDDYLLRQVVYEGLREDKPATEVRREVPYPKLGTHGHSPLRKTRCAPSLKSTHRRRICRFTSGFHQIQGAPSRARRDPMPSPSVTGSPPSSLIFDRRFPKQRTGPVDVMFASFSTGSVARRR